MKRDLKAQTHPLQMQRLEALHGYGILDTDPEADFDEIADLAAAVCGTAIAVVNFIDAERQWFKAEVGLGVRETPLETSLCSHVILEQDYVEIADTLQDPRMQDNPLCLAEPGLRFYAGVLLKSPEGLPLGTLCVLDRQPRSLTDQQRKTLRVLGRQVMTLLELRRAFDMADIHRREADHRIKNSLQSLMSFIRIQDRQIARGASAEEVLGGVMARIQAMIRVHEQIYSDNGSDRVDMRETLTPICRDLQQLAPPNVVLTESVPSVSVPSKVAIAAGTFVSEFVTNSFKHAFPDGREGIVSIELSGEDELVLTCSDDGIGMSEAPETPSGLGSNLMDLLAAELQAEVQHDGAPPGVSVSLRFERSGS
ncbi:sensor histidine kinase [Marinibacterium profundimaris]|uniref:sensor histidine kinase n=1 Tax=Marinibacterium profundimaris TaxID=1679460 RepID=UPI001E5A2FD7|nr:histidine kinase dimerization/phosphoacceptor domain -containing protein [Marinibacterium profundimaris]